MAMASSNNSTMESSSSPSSSMSRLSEAMDASSAPGSSRTNEPQPPQPPQRHSSRRDVRDAIERIVRRLLLSHLIQRRSNSSAHASASNGVQLSQSHRRRAAAQARLLEDILYRRADAIEEYCDMTTLEERVYKAGRAVYLCARRAELARRAGRSASGAREEAAEAPVGSGAEGGSASLSSREGAGATSS